MGYLHPPPLPAPVVIVRDVGGLVADYRRQTEIYRSQGRELRLHECRSACTLALSLPNVCVYPHSVLRFHQAYNRDTREIDHRISDELFTSYPLSVRQRLGYLTRKYKSLSGEELIALGIRNCNESPVLYANRKARQRTQIASAEPQPGQSVRAGSEPGILGRLTGAVTGIFTSSTGRSATIQTASRASVPSTPKFAMKATPSPAGPVPLPPPRPLLETDTTPVATIEPVVTPQEGQPPRERAPIVAPAQTAFAAPLPPRRPEEMRSAGTVHANLARVGAPKLITGAYPVLPQTLSAYAPLR